MYGSDQEASIDFYSLKYLVGAVKKVAIAQGDGEKKFLDEEKIIAKKLRVHLPKKYKLLMRDYILIYYDLV